jgi:NNP family nitrate/nitrite transporter-like MFS transporter
VIFRNEKLAAVEGLGPEAREIAMKRARVEGAAVLGLVAAIGACGGYLIPRTFAASIASTGSAHSALVAFVAFYVSCIVLTWVFYGRVGQASVRVASVEARV